MKTTLLAIAVLLVCSVNTTLAKPGQESIRSALESGLALTVGAESANVITTVVAGSASATYEFYVLDADGLLGVATDWTCDETGAGALVTSADKPSGIFMTSAAGAASLACTDVAGASGLTIYLVVRPLGPVQPAQYGTLTYD